MKIMILTLGFLLSSSTFAAECFVKGAKGETVSLKNHGRHYYTVSVYGHSRNNYSALYQGASDTFGERLVKIVDHSTWSDMPENLRLGYPSMRNPDVSNVALTGLPWGGYLFYDCQLF